MTDADESTEVEKHYTVGRDETGMTARAREVLAMFRGGATQMEIVARAGINRSRVSQFKKRLEKEGLLPDVGRLQSVFAYVAVDEDDQERIIRTTLPNGQKVQLLGDTEAQAILYQSAAQRYADQTQAPVRLVWFEKRAVMEPIMWPHPEPSVEEVAAGV